MITIGNVVEVCSIINEASSKLTMIIGEQVELRLVTPVLPGIDFNQQVIVRMDREIMIHTITTIVCEQFMISIAALRGSDRTGSICDARKITSLLLHDYVVDITDLEIGNILKMSRSNALQSRDKAKDLLDTNGPFRFQYNQVLKRLKKAMTDNG